MCVQFVSINMVSLCFDLGLNLFRFMVNLFRLVLHLYWYNLFHFGFKFVSICSKFVSICFASLLVQFLGREFSLFWFIFWECVDWHVWLALGTLLSLWNVDCVIVLHLADWHVYLPESGTKCFQPLVTTWIIFM